MERLTKYLASGAVAYDYPADCHGSNTAICRVIKSAYRQRCAERLAAYEDTGLTPEEVDLLSKAGEEGRVVVYDTREEAEEALRRAENG